jgi:hypothetical protein
MFMRVGVVYMWSVKYGVAPWCRTIHNEGREIISNFIEICDEARHKQLLVLKSQATERAVMYTGKS